MTGFLRNLRKNVGRTALSCCEGAAFAAVESGLIEETSFAAVESEMNDLIRRFITSAGDNYGR